MFLMVNLFIMLLALFSHRKSKKKQATTPLISKKNKDESMDYEFMKNSLSKAKGIAIELDKLNGGHHLSLTLDDVRGMTEPTTRTPQRGNERQT